MKEEKDLKIIVSHDVDHIDSWDHILKDLILEKMIVRSFFQVAKKKITLKTFLYRISMIFHKRMNRIQEVMEFDKKHNIPSIFFFGMSNVLGMSYSQKKAMPYIKKVKKNGFDTGVHGCDYLHLENIKKEYEDFGKISEMKSFGIRNHYVRFDNDTFNKMEKVGYLFDSTYFNKEKIEYVNPYKVGDMWEFPLLIMDGYVCMQGKLQEGLEKTFRIIEEANNRGMKYCTILFHDYQYDDIFDPQRKEWYERTIQYCEQNNYKFISYRDAIKELESE